MKTWRNFLKICLFLQELEEIIQLQMSISKRWATLDVQKPRNPCFCPKTDPIGTEPEGIKQQNMFVILENHKVAPEIIIISKLPLQHNEQL